MVNNSINQLVSDIFQIYFNSKPSDDNQLSRTEVESWIHQYRALLIRQDLDKGRDINESYMQTIPALELEAVDYGIDADLITGVHRYRTKLRIPKPIDMAYGLPLLVYTLTGEQIQIMPISRASFQKYRKFTSESPRAMYHNNYIYIEGCSLIEYITVKGVFESPQEMTQYLDPNGSSCYDPDGAYPVPVNLIPVIRQMILQKELGIMIQMPSDVTNNSNEERQQTSTNSAD